MITLYICGDSTAATYEPDRLPQAGWGQLLQSHLTGDIKVDNRATCARSSKSFIAEGRLTAIEEALNEGDYIFIQFAHNDHTQLIWRHTLPFTSFMDHLTIYINTARLYGANPVLVTPICQRIFDEKGVFGSSHEEYVKAIKVLGKKLNVPVIDVYTQSMKEVGALGEENSKAYYLHTDSLADNTHTSYMGAAAFAKIAARGIKEAGLSISQYVKEESL